MTRVRAAQKLNAICFNIISYVTHDMDRVMTPIRCQRQGVSIKMPCRDICPQDHTQCWHPSLTINPADCLPTGPWSINNGHHPSFPVSTANNVLSFTRVDRPINWSVIKLGLSYTASQVPTCILGQLWVHEGIISGLIVITHTWWSRGSLRGPAHCWDVNDIMLPPKSLLLPG